MGMFDYIHYDGELYQSKDTPNQAIDNYEIKNNELWVEEYDCEWVQDENSLLKGYLERSNKRWRFCKEFDGNIRFYRENKDEGGYKEDAWIEYSALFMNGKVIKFTKL